MIDTLTLLAFIPAAVALNLTPGADMMFCLGQGLRGGPRPAVAASAGIVLGGMVHVTLAGLGLGAAIATLPWLFDVIRWAGIAYLLWLAWQALKSDGALSVRPDPSRPAKPTTSPLVTSRSNGSTTVRRPKFRKDSISGLR